MGGTGSQRYTGFRCTIPQHIIYTVYCTVCRPKSSLCSPPFIPPLPPPTFPTYPLPLAVTTLMSASIKLFSLFFAPQFLRSPAPPSQQLSVCYLSLSLFCFLIHLFIILHISEIIWYFLWLISLSTLLSRSIKAIAKDKISFYFVAKSIFLTICVLYFICKVENHLNSVCKALLRNTRLFHFVAFLLHMEIIGILKFFIMSFLVL